MFILHFYNIYLLFYTISLPSEKSYFLTYISLLGLKKQIVYLCISASFLLTLFFFSFHFPPTVPIELSKNNYNFLYY
ncbi:putative membrane protein [Bacteroides fragilis str. 3397 N2]|nr:putative membrane protein [Bacteroides fragilis str. 3397 N2]